MSPSFREERMKHMERCKCKLHPIYEAAPRCSSVKMDPQIDLLIESVRGEVICRVALKDFLGTYGKIFEGDFLFWPGPT